jgi:hypothetical protein
MDKDKGMHRPEGIPYNVPLFFTVLSMRGHSFQRVHSIGTITDACKSGIEIIIDFPVQPGHVLQWDDIHKPGTLHTAIVKWSVEEEGLYRGGLKFL